MTGNLRADIVALCDAGVGTWQADGLDTPVVEVDAILAALAAHPAEESAGAGLIAAERKRQVEVEGYTAEHDDGHARDLLAAASCYLSPGIGVEMGNHAPFGWPWDPRYWKPTPTDRVRELVKAGALIAAAIDAHLAAARGERS